MKKPIYQLKQEYLTIFQSRSKAEAINILKKIHGISEIRDITDCLKSVYNKLPDDIEGILYPSSLNDICHKKSTFFKPESVISELNWFLAYARNNWKQLSWFSKKKTEYEHNFLLGNFEICHKILDEIRKTLGISLWYYEQKCVLFEYEGDSKASMDLISNSLKSCSDINNYIPWLVYYLYERSSRKLSPFKFDEDLNALYKKNKTDLHEDYYRYVLFRMNYYNQYEDIDLALPLMFESISSLVDRYLIVISILKASLVKDVEDNNAISRGLYLYRKTKDKSLLPFAILSGIKINNDYYDSRYMEILDSYYKGEYDRCKSKSSLFLKEDASCFDAIFFYCRSLIYLNHPFENPYMEKMDAPINIITRYVYNDLTFYNAQDNLYALYQINKNIYSFHISAAIDHFYKVEQNEAVNSAQKYLSITRFDPIFTRMWNDDDKSLDYINSFASQKGPSVACDVWRKRVRHESIDDDTLPEHITGPINTEFLFREKKYEDSFNYSRKLYLSALDCVPIRQTAVARMVECLFCQNKIQDAINLYVKYYIEDLPSVVKVDTLSIIHQLQDTLYENIRRNLNLVIFVALTCKEAVDISFILLEFCELKGVQKPSELFNVLSPDLEGVKNLELLYSLLNDDEILKNYSIIDSFEDRLIERKKLLQYIISLNTPRKDTYIELLKKVDDALLVYNFSHNLDESKIYANEEAIINYKLNEIDGKYSRFRLLVDTFIEQKKDILVVNLSQSIFDDQNYEQESKANLAIRTNGLYEIFNSLYQDIKEQFLYSDYGLVAYLSTRVRHGELESMLRPEVAQRHLILSTRDNVYQEDSYWTTTYNLGVREQSLLYNALQQFSTGFDYAVTSLIKKKLQIYDDKDRPEGLFNYEAEDKELALKAMEAGLSLKKMDDSKVAFFKFMFSWLWEKTEKSLIVIRNYVDQDFRSSIFQLIADLETTIKENMPTGHAQTDMLSEIRSASESLDAKIQKVSKWFNISHPKFDNVDFGTVSNKIYETVKSSHTDCVTNDILNIQGESFMIHADYVMHYVDILRNILSNMFAHGADSKDNKRHFKLDIVIGEENVILNFENYINCNPDDLNKIFAEKLKAKGLAFSEGGSGIAKVNKILKEDLKSNDNQIHMNAEGMICSTQVIIMLQNFKAYE